MKRIRILCIALALITLGGRSVQAQERVMGEQVVAVVGNSMILWSEVVETMNAITQQQREQGYTSNRDGQCEALEQLLMQKMLASQARLDSLDQNMSFAQIDNAIENHINGLIEDYGSLRTLEAVYRKPSYQIRDDLREKYVEMQLAQIMEMTIRNDVTVIPSEVDRFYRRVNKDSLQMVPEQYVYAQVVMYPPSIDDAKLRTRERLLEFRERIMNGDRFSTLARLYSVDPGSAARGGEMDFMPRDGFVKPFADALAKLRPGQISPVVETEFGFHIIELMEIRGNNYKARHILLRPDFTTEELMVTAHQLDSIANLIRNEEITFADAATRFSEDNFSKHNGGVVTNHEIVEYMQADAGMTSTRFFREDLGNDYVVIRGLKPGEVSESFQTQDLRGNQLTKIIMLKEIIPPHRANINEDYILIENLAVKTKQDRIYNEWLEKKIAAMYIKIDPKFTGCDFENKGWVK